MKVTKEELDRITKNPKLVEEAVKSGFTAKKVLEMFADDSDVQDALRDEVENVGHAHEIVYAYYDKIFAVAGMADIRAEVTVLVMLKVAHEATYDLICEDMTRDDFLRYIELHANLTYNKRNKEECPG